jgi:hypothetical protein
MNSSTMLAKRTKKLIQEIKPDTILVMCSEDWWKHAKLIEGVTSQEEFDSYNEEFLASIDDIKLDTSAARGVIFWTRLWMMRLYLKMNFMISKEFKFWAPGLEIKYACEAAQKVGANLLFLGPELNNVTWHRLYHETRMNVPSALWNTWKTMGTRYSTEVRTEAQKMELTTPSTFTET